MEKVKDKDKIDIKEVRHVLDFLVCRKNFGFSGEALKRLSIDEIKGYLEMELEYQLHILLPAESVKEAKHTVSLYYPATWWQAWKEMHYPNWLRNRWPVIYMEKKETVTFKAYEVYPRWPVIAPDRCGDSFSAIVTSSVEEWNERVTK